MTSKSRTDFLTFAFERAEYEQDELSDRWKTLDAKAQSTATIAGVIMAAALVLVRNTNFDIPFLAQSLLIILLLALAATIASAVWSMQVMTVSLPTTAEDAARMVREAIARPTEELEDRYAGLLVDHIDKWILALAEVHEAVHVKAGRLKVAQFCLLAAVALAVGLIVVTTVS